MVLGKCTKNANYLLIRLIKHRIATIYIMGKLIVYNSIVILLNNNPMELSEIGGIIVVVLLI